MLMENTSISVNDLSKHFGVSVVTIRKDLRALDTSGAIVRGHGVAHSVVPKVGSGYSVRQRMMINHEEKMHIAAKAASMVNERDVVLLSPGSTCCMIAQELCKQKNIIIVTNAVCFQAELTSVEARIIYLGGEYNSLNGSTIGSFTLDALSALNIDKFFLGANGVSVEAGITSYDFSDTMIVRSMIERSKEVILVTDHTKFGKSSALRLADIKEVDTIITGKDLDPKIQEQFFQKKMNMVLL